MKPIVNINFGLNTPKLNQTLKQLIIYAPINLITYVN